MKSSNDFAIIDSIAHALIALLIVLVLTACGGGGGDAPPDGSAPPGNGPPATEGTLPFKVMPARASLALQGQAALMAIGSNGAVTWTSSEPTVASVDASGVVTALARGAATITASDGSGAASSATVQVWDTGGAQPDASTEALIDAALAAGRIDAEQALVYRVYAQFGDDRLPPEFDGAPDRLGGVSLRLLSAQLPTLSQATQDTLRPFLMPPIYRESWFGRQLGLSRAPQPAPLARERAAQALPFNCALAELLPSLERRTTVSFTLWTLRSNEMVQVIDSFAEVVEDIYARQRQLIGRAAKSDLGEDCNGNDGSTDIYIFPYGKAAETVAYPDRCEDVPSFVVIDAARARRRFTEESLVPNEGPRYMRSVLAHELLHTIQFGMDRKAACADYKWIDEATAQWVMDYVFQVDNFEDGIDKHEPGAFARSGIYFADYVLGGHMRALELPSNAANADLNGYGDYVFFQFIALKYGAPVIKNLFDAWINNNSVDSIDVALKASGTRLRDAWPEFALAMWNDNQNQVQDELSRWDGYDFGVKREFDRDPQYDRPLKSVKAELQGGRADLELLSNLKSGGAFVLPPRSMAFERIVFDDNNVSAVLISNPFLEFENPDVRLQALVKISGQWKPAANWSFEATKFFCRDQANERLQELVLIVSNSAAGSNAPPATIAADKPLLVSTSNVGCWKWRGSASYTALGGNETGSTETEVRGDDIEFSRRDDGLAFMTPFAVTAGRAAATGITRVSLSQCTTTATALVTEVTSPADGQLGFNLDLKSHEIVDPDRKLLEAAGSTVINTTLQFVCPGVNETRMELTSWGWLGLLTAQPLAVSSDGRTITGDLSITTNGVTDRQIFTFTALRE
jgi:hypothetical protein